MRQLPQRINLPLVLPAYADGIDLLSSCHIDDRSFALASWPLCSNSVVIGVLSEEVLMSYEDGLYSLDNVIGYTGDIFAAPTKFLNTSE